MFGIDQPIWAWVVEAVVVAHVVYVAGAVLLALIVGFFLGEAAKDDFIYLAGIPFTPYGWVVSIALTVVGFVWAVVRMPVRQRKKVLFLNTFLFTPSGLIFNPPEGRYGQWPGNNVDRELPKLAKQLQEAYDLQARVRRNSAYVSSSYESADERVRESKKAFWDAHGLAAYFGYEVHKSYKDYMVEKPNPNNAEN